MDTTLRIGPSFSIEAAGRGKLCECPVWMVLWLLCLAVPFLRWFLKCQYLLPYPAFEVGLGLFGCVTLVLIIATNIDPGTVPRNVAWLPPDETALGFTARPSEALAPPGMAGRVSVHNGVELRHKFCSSCGVVRPIRAVHCRMTDRCRCPPRLTTRGISHPQQMRTHNQAMSPVSPSGVWRSGTTIAGTSASLSAGTRRAVERRSAAAQQPPIQLSQSARRHAQALHCTSTGSAAGASDLLREPEEANLHRCRPTLCSSQSR
jgi:palmitoyltransferase ZDHHC9/14/18